MGASRSADSFPDTPEEIAAHLRDDPVLVTQVMGNGFTDEITQELHDKVAEVEFPVYVVLTDTGLVTDAGTVDEELASLVHAELDRDGVYVVHTPGGMGHVGVWGDLYPGEEDDQVQVSLAAFDARSEVEAAVEDVWGQSAHLAPAAEAAATVDVVERADDLEYGDPVLTTAEREAYTRETWVSEVYAGEPDSDPPELPGPGLSAVLATAVGVTVAVVGYRLLRAVAAPRVSDRGDGNDRRSTSRGGGREEPIIERLRERARLDLASLEQALERPSAAQLPADRLDRATGSRDVAAELVSSDHLLDVVGARVLALTGLAAVDRQRRPYRCCYVNPLHGDARHDAALPGGLRVPVCRPCGRALADGEQPDSLREPSRGRDRPYYVGDSVWARTGFGALTDDLWRDVLAERRR